MGPSLHDKSSCKRLTGEALRKKSGRPVRQADLGVRRLERKECLEPPEAARDEEVLSLRAFGRKVALWRP